MNAPMPQPAADLRSALDFLRFEEIHELAMSAASLWDSTPSQPSEGSP